MGLIRIAVVLFVSVFSLPASAAWLSGSVAELADATGISPSSMRVSYGNSGQVAIPNDEGRFRYRATWQNETEMMWVYAKGVRKGYIGAAIYSISSGNVSVSPLTTGLAMAWADIAADLLVPPSLQSMETAYWLNRPEFRRLGETLAHWVFDRGLILYDKTVYPDDLLTHWVRARGVLHEDIYTGRFKNKY